MAARTARLPTLWIKVGLVAALLVAADVLVFQMDGHGPPGLGPLLLAFAAAALVGHAAVRRNPISRLAAAAAAAFALIEVEHFTPLGWLLFWTALGVAVLAPRAGARDGAFQWAQRLAALGAVGLVAPILDLLRFLKARGRRGSVRLQTVLLTLALPTIGAVVFVWLFAAANPLISGWFESLQLPAPDIARVLFWGFVGLLAWGTLRPRSLRKVFATPEAQGDLALPGVTAASITLSLIVFNAVFLLQNGLDLAFLWTGAKLPDGQTFAGYAHRGAYPLIATALLAGLFVLVFLRPGTETAKRPLVRWLVIAWTVQNVFLVASTALRTIYYIEAYSLTRLRIAALVWMALVAVGLGLICWRVLRDKSAAWLINANVLAAGAVLAACSVVDLGSIAAAWNVRNAREVGGTGVGLDWAYMKTLDEAAFVSLLDLERSTADADVRLRANHLRCEIMQRMREQQSDWRAWTWRRERRLAGTPGALSCWSTLYSVPRPLTLPANPR